LTRLDLPTGGCAWLPRVFASDKNRAIAGSELHTNFKLTAGGEHLALIRIPLNVVDASTISSVSLRMR